MEPGAICQKAHPQQAKTGKYEDLLRLKTLRSSVAWEFFTDDSIVVSKSKRMVDVSFALFARFAGNDRISDLLSMLA